MDFLEYLQQLWEHTEWHCVLPASKLRFTPQASHPCLHSYTAGNAFYSLSSYQKGEKGSSSFSKEIWKRFPLGMYQLAEILDELATQKRKKDSDARINYFTTVDCRWQGGVRATQLRLCMCVFPFLFAIKFLPQSKKNKFGQC